MYSANLIEDDNENYVYNSLVNNLESAGNSYEFVEAISDIRTPDTDVGTHSAFAEMQDEGDSVYNTMTEEDVGGSGVSEDRYVDTSPTLTTWNPGGSTPYLDAVDTTNYITSSGTTAFSVWMEFGETSGSGSGFTVNLEIYADNDDGDEDIHWEVDWTSDGTAEASGDWLNVPVTPQWYDTGVLSGLDTQAEIDQATIRFSTTKGAGGPGVTTIDAARIGISQPGSANYDLDLEVGWTAATFDEVNEELCIFADTQGSEALRVDIWDDVSTNDWVNVFDDIVPGWNNISLNSGTDYLWDASFEVRFTDTTGDAVEADTWDIGAVLLHTWTDPPPSAFSMYEDAEDPDFDGYFQLTWDAPTPVSADDYTVYEYDEWITEINGSLDVLVSETTDLYWDVSSQTNGTWYFIVEAQNVAGTTISNCVTVVVQDSPWDFWLSDDASSPEVNGDYQLSWSIALGADNYTVYEHNEWITTLNDSLTTLSWEQTLTYYDVTTQANGTWYYKIEAQNEVITNTTSNCITITVLDIPWPLTLINDASTPEVNGDFQLDWETSTSADNYTVYEYNAWITEINGSVTILELDVTNTYYDITSHTNGTWYFIVEATNYAGNTTSNCNEVIILDTPWAFSLTHDADEPDHDGDFQIDWDDSIYADNYTVYVNEAWITEINGTVEIVELGIGVSYYDFDGYTNGTWYFLVEATNYAGNETSNCIEITVQDGPWEFTLISPDAQDPDHDGTFQLDWDASIGADNYTIYRYDDWITIINGSLTILKVGETETFYDIISLTNGTWYFIIEATNYAGNTTSNCLEIIVQDTPFPMSLTSDAGSPDHDGDYTLSWLPENGADNWTIYQATFWITTINDTITALVWEKDTPLTYFINDQANGTWYYLIEAQNEAGNSTSNCLEIIVQDSPWPFTLTHDADDPDYDGDFQLDWDVSTEADNYTIYEYDGWITDINGSLTILKVGETLTYYDIISHTNGTWYFIIESTNYAGNTTSNCVTVTIGEPPWEFT